MADVQGINNNWGRMNKDQRSRALSAMSPEEQRTFADLRKGTRPDAVNNPLPDSLIPATESNTTIGPAPSWAERARNYAINAPAIIGGIAGNIAGLGATKSRMGMAAGGAIGSAVGGAYSEGLKQMDNPMIRGYATMGLPGMALEYLAEREEDKRGDSGKGVHEPKSTRSVPRAALDEGVIAGVGEGLGLLIPGGAITKRILAPPSKDTAIKKVATNLGLEGDVPANVQNRGWIPGLLDKMARLTEPGTNTLSQQVQRLAGKLNSKLNDTITEIAGIMPINPMTNRQFGEQVGKAIDAAETLTKAPISEQFKAIENATAARMVENRVEHQVPILGMGGKPILSASGMPVLKSELGTEHVTEGGVWASTADIKKAVQSAWGHISPQDLHLPQNIQAKQLIDEYTNLPDKLTVHQLMEMRSDLLAKARRARNVSKLEAVEFSLAKTLDSNIESTLTHAGMKDLALEYGSARSAWREASELFNNRYIEQVTKHAKDRPEAVTHLLFTPGHISRTDSIVKALEKNNPENYTKIMNTIRRDKFTQMRIKADETKSPSESLAKGWFSLEPEQQKILAGGSISHKKTLDEIFGLYRALSPEEIAKKMGGDVGSLEQHSKVSAISTGALAGIASMGGAGALVTGDPVTGILMGITGYIAPAGLAKILASEKATRTLSGYTRDLFSNKLLTAEAVVSYGTRAGRLVYQTEDEIDNARKSASVLGKTPSIDMDTVPNTGAF